MTHTEIHLDGGRGRLVIDGHDISNGVQAFTLHAGVDQIPELDIDLLVVTGDVIGEAEARTYLPDATTKALVALGWTPPPTEAAAAVCPTCGSAQPHLHPTKDLCPDPWHKPIPATAAEWRAEVDRWSNLLDGVAGFGHSIAAVERIAADMRREVEATKETNP